MPTDHDSTLDVADESFNPWSVVHLVFRHLADQGLHPVLGESGDPSLAAAELLRTLGVEPAAEGNRAVRSGVHQVLAELRVAVFESGWLEETDDGTAGTGGAAAPGGPTVR